MSYVTAIKTAVLFFPMVAFLFTIPFILHQYHKYGSIHKLRVLIVYSFILYLLCVYFLVILPLPDINTMEPPTENMIRLVPFGFVYDIIRETSFRIQDPSTYFKALLDPCVYTVLFNILMTIPFGIYLRYYFNCDQKQTVFFTFLLSLFFELTQLSRLYFIYPYPYRVFDVDDLIVNTFGGFLGYHLAAIFNLFLPSRMELDQKSYLAGERVSGLRRMTLFWFDFLVIFILGLNLWLWTGSRWGMLLLFFLYYTVVPFILKKQTLGGRFLNVKLEYPKYGFLLNLFYYLFLYFYYLGIPMVIFRISMMVVDYYQMVAHEAILCYFFIFLFLLVFFLGHVIHLLRCGSIYYDRFFHCHYVSTIKEKEF